ncbi:TPA: glycerol-3-phosphate ABC transporter ATP-binding protein, partial [Candidatus Marinimicrobia bacterium]|nr:glycerol-3-phosphate ABC transporter ATP-binding protein [Candidatus Neomarinimicrobiota bacterium]
MAQIVLKNIDKTFDERQKVIDNLNLTIHDGEFLVLVGPSGCGKSTTLRLIAGLESATAGDIFIGETCVNHIPPKDRDISMVFQNYALYPHMTVHDNIAFGLKLRKYPKEEIEQRVQEAADILEIHSLLKRKPKQLSGGQRQRVALGRAIVRKPKVFLFDEPLSNLDAKLRVQMRAEIKKLHRQLKTTMVYVTHDQVEAMTMGDRIAIMKDGIIHQLDTPMEIYQNPADIFVAGFIGSPSMNFIPAVITDDQTLYSKDMDLAFDFPESCRNSLKNESEKEVIIGIRPEHLYITPPNTSAVPIQ